MNDRISRAGVRAAIPAAALAVLGMLAIATTGLATPWSDGPQAKIPEVDEAACRENLLVIADAEAEYFAEYGCYADPVGLETSGILPGATALLCPYEGMSYTYTISATSYAVECPCEGHSHGRIVDGGPSW